MSVVSAMGASSSTYISLASDGILVANLESCNASGTVVPSHDASMLKKILANQEIGYFYLRQRAYYETASIGDNGPNQGFKYVTSMSSTSNNVTTAFLYVVAQDLETTSSTFYTSQCGNYDAQNNPNGFISGSNLLAGTIRHEAGSADSHYANYVAAQNDPANDLGVVGEMQVGPPSQSLTDFGNSTVSDALGAKETAIRTATQVEPCAVNYDASCNFQGFVNYSPYQSCQ